METALTETTAAGTDTTVASSEPELKPEKASLFEELPEPEEYEESQPDQPKEENPKEKLKREDIKLPDGYEYDSELGDSFLEVLNDEKLSRKELGQKLFDIYHEQGKKFFDGLKAAESERTKKFQKELEQEKAEWLKRCESDKEYGGQNWDASQAVIDRCCRHLATDEAVKLMQAYNLNTHPEIVRMFYRAGLLAGEDKSQMSGNGSGKEKDAAMAIFGESLKEYHKRRGEI